MTLHRCDICLYEKDYEATHHIYEKHLCPKCMVNCPRWIKYDVNTGEITYRRSIPGETEYDPFKGQQERGQHVAMRKVQ